MRIAVAMIAGAVFVTRILPSDGAFAAGETACSGEACGALTPSDEGCAWTNKGDKSVRLAVTAATDAGAAKASPIVTVLAPGEKFKDSAERCSKLAGTSMRYEASFAVLAEMAEDPAAPAPVKAAPPVPKLKPAAPLAARVPVIAAVAASPPSLATPAAVAAVAPPPVPKRKPVWPPLPRVKPEPPVQAAEVSALPVAAVSAAPMSPVDAASCGNACNEILFKVVDNCLWVQNPNPRPIAFEAEIAGKTATLALEGANAAKADARNAALAKGDAAAAEVSYHTRVHDPFVSVSDGIPVFRARLGGAAACVKDRKEIAKFTARFAK